MQFTPSFAITDADRAAAQSILDAAKARFTAQPVLQAARAEHAQVLAARDSKHSTPAVTSATRAAVRAAAASRLRQTLTTVRSNHFAPLAPASPAITAGAAGTGDVHVKAAIVADAATPTVAAAAMAPKADALRVQLRVSPLTVETAETTIKAAAAAAELQYECEVDGEAAVAGDTITAFMPLRAGASKSDVEALCSLVKGLLEAQGDLRLAANAEGRRGLAFTYFQAMEPGERRKGDFLGSMIAKVFESVGVDEPETEASAPALLRHATLNISAPVTSLVEAARAGHNSSWLDLCDAASVCLDLALRRQFMATIERHCVQALVSGEANGETLSSLQSLLSMRQAADAVSATTVEVRLAPLKYAFVEAVRRIAAQIRRYLDRSKIYGDLGDTPKAYESTLPESVVGARNSYMMKLGINAAVLRELPLLRDALEGLEDGEEADVPPPTLLALLLRNLVDGVTEVSFITSSCRMDASVTGFTGDVLHAMFPYATPEDIIAGLRASAVAIRTADGKEAETPLEKLDDAAADLRGIRRAAKLMYYAEDALEAMDPRVDEFPGFDYGFNTRRLFGALLEVPAPVESVTRVAILTPDAAPVFVAALLNGLGVWSQLKRVPSATLRAMLNPNDEAEKEESDDDDDVDAVVGESDDEDDDDAPLAHVLYEALDVGGLQMVTVKHAGTGRVFKFFVVANDADSGEYARALATADAVVVVAGMPWAAGDSEKNIITAITGLAEDEETRAVVERPVPLHYIAMNPDVAPSLNDLALTIGSAETIAKATRATVPAGGIEAAGEQLVHWLASTVLKPRDVTPGATWDLGAAPAVASMTLSI
jgi:hypothetical protein